MMEKFLQGFTKLLRRVVEWRKGMEARVSGEHAPALPSPLNRLRGQP
jgi:hypothetical protein